MALVTLHLHETNRECAYETTKSCAWKISRLSISQASGRIPPAYAMPSAVSIQSQS